MPHVNQDSRSHQTDSNSDSVDNSDVKLIQEKPSRNGNIRGVACTVVEQLCDFNVNRKGLYIFNGSATRNLYIGVSESQASLSIAPGNVSYTAKIPFGQSWSPPGNVKYIGRVFGVFDGAATADEKAHVTEYQ